MLYILMRNGNEEFRGDRGHVQLFTSLERAEAYIVTLQRLWERFKSDYSKGPWKVVEVTITTSECELPITGPFMF